MMEYTFEVKSKTIPTQIRLPKGFREKLENYLTEKGIKNFKVITFEVKIKLKEIVIEKKIKL